MRDTKRVSVRIVGVRFCLGLVSSLAAAPAATQTAEERFLVELDSTGDADISVTFTYELDSETERAAFEEPEANETARTFIVAAPDGNTLTSVEPEPSESDETSVTWEAGTSLEDFEVVVEPTDTDRDGEMDDEADGETPTQDATEDTPGFGAGIALAALLGAGLLASHRR